nr:MAG TPA: hypothetical protein [Caudoviricetes sp.]
MQLIFMTTGIYKYHYLLIVLLKRKKNIILQGMLQYWLFTSKLLIF